MRKYLLFVLFAISFLNRVKAEVLMPTIDTNHEGLGTALWMTYYHAETEDGASIDTRIDYQIVSERTVNGENYSVLSASDRFGENMPMNLLYRQEENKVYLLCDSLGEKKLILDFDLKVGDEFTTFDGDKLIVKETGLFNEYDSLLYKYGEMSEIRPRMLRLTDKDGHEDVWIEGIGSVYWGIVPNSLTNERVFGGKKCRIISSRVTLVKSVISFQYGAFFNANEPQYKFRAFELNTFDNDEEMTDFLDKIQYQKDFLSLSFEGDTLCVKGTASLNCYTTFIECFMSENNETELHIGQHVFPGYEKDCLGPKWVNVRIPGFQSGIYHFTSWSGPKPATYPLDVTLVCKGTAQEYFPEGTKWTEIRMDTTKYDSWYSKVGDEWVPNFETIEYYVKGEADRFTLDRDTKSFKCIYTDGPERSDSLTLYLYEGNVNNNMGVHVTVPLLHECGEVLWPGTAYQFDWEVGKMIEFKEILDANTTYLYPPGSFDFGRIEEIKEGTFGGVRPLNYVDLNGVRIIQGIGVTTWNDGECIFGPVKPYEALSFMRQVSPVGTVQSETRDFCSMLVHFERDGEVLYDVWPEKSDNSVAINEENFPDEYFRQYLLSKDYGQDGILTAEELKGIKTLILNFDKAEEAAADLVPKIPLRSLKGLEFFTELEVLNCNDCLLTELNLTCNNKLKELECAGNKLTELDLSQNRELRSINCSLNNLEDLDITNNEALTSFVGMHNPFHSALDFSHQHNLKTLYVAICNLNSLDLSQNPELTTLSCIGNDLTYLDLSHNPKLIELYCGDNHGLTEINLKNCPKLQLVLCDECQLKALDLSQCLDLKRVSCINNQLESLILNPDAEVQNSLYILGNRLSEQAMLDFINSLHPNTTSDPIMYRLYAMGPADKEKNECTEKVIKAAYERGWTIFDSTGNVYVAPEVPNICDFEPILTEGRTWNYVVHDTYTMADYCHSLQIGGDTIASDIPCKKILYIQDGKVQLHSLMYEKDGRVYSRSDDYTDEIKTEDGEWTLFYDFNLKEGETFEWMGESYRVVETDTLNTYGHKRRRIHFCKEGWEYNKGVFTWIEGIGGKDGLDEPFTLSFNRYAIYLQSCYDGEDIIYSAKGNEMVNAYRPFVEEGKVWKMGWYKEGVEPTTSAPERIECQYLQGDTIIEGLQYKRLMISEDENMPARYAGAVREDQRVVLFCPIGSTVPLRLYDFASPAGTGGRYINFFLDIDVLFEVNLGEIFVIDTETYKGCGREVRFNGQQKVTWLQGVGHMGLYSLDTSIMYGGSFRLLSCTVGDEVLYYDSSLMPQESEAKKKKLDFTHVIKAQPRAPRHRARQEGDGTLEGEYSVSELFVRLNALTGDYTATLSDASGQVVYQKTVLTDNVLALSTALTAYGPGNYVLTLENDEEAYTATLNIEPNGIRPTPGPSRNGGELYDLQGRRLMKAPEKGIYIQDGKKKTHPQPLP